MSQSSARQLLRTPGQTLLVGNASKMQHAETLALVSWHAMRSNKCKHSVCILQQEAKC